MNAFNWIFYNICKFTAFVLMKIFCRMEIRNKEVLPPHNKAVLLVGNHTSWLDKLLVSFATLRHTWFVTGDFILDVPVMNWIVKQVGIIQMRRGCGKQGIELAVNKLKEGKIVCIFPEGVLTSDGEIQRFRTGVGIIQKAAQVPVIPFYIDGAYDIWSFKYKLPRLFRKATITFGEPFLPQEEKESDIAQEIKAKVLELK